MSNISNSIKQKIGISLHNKLAHPIKIIKEYIYNYFDNNLNIKFDKFDNFDPYVSVENNFDLLRITSDHPSRSIHDTYYVNSDTVLRTHTSAHQNELLNKGYKNFLVTGDVYRKDEIDSKHFNIFHQMEGVCILSDDVNPENELKKILTGLIEYLFPNKEYRFNLDYFPFTEPSFEVEVKFADKWLEILGCGVIHREILDRLNIKQQGIAFGLGIERLAMILFDIPDIRYFWTNDVRFMEQFKDEKIIKFKPYPKLNPITKDISFWIDYDEVNLLNSGDFAWKNINDFYEWVRDICNDNIANVTILDHFYHQKKNKYSMTFRFTIESDLEETNPSKLETYANNIMYKMADYLKEKKYVIR